MQHPDEGTIHSWLDGALSADDAAQVESHVAGCEQCRTAVAEARGFIAASSRILTALDDVPGGVVPVAAPRKRNLNVAWRAAAAMVIVAGGSLIMMRDGEESAETASSRTAAIATEATASAASDDAVADGGTGTGADARLASPPPRASAMSERRAAPVAPTRARAEQPAPSAARDLRAEKGTAQNYSAQTGLADTQRSVTAGAIRIRGAVSGAASVAGPVAPLKVVKVEPRIGQRITTYEVAAGDTVTLTEATALRLGEVVVTGASGVAEAAQTAQRQATANRTRAVAPMTDRAAAAPPPPPPVDSLRRRDSAAAGIGAMSKTAAVLHSAVVSPAGQTNTIRWTDASGNALTLSGRMPIARLEEIKLRIERERAAERTKAP